MIYECTSLPEPQFVLAHQGFQLSQWSPAMKQSLCNSLDLA